jgi:hypothetical protein
MTKESKHMSRKNGVAIIPQRSAGPVDKALGLKIRTARHEAELQAEHEG